MMDTDGPECQIITVVSTYTTDRITLPDGRAVAIPGGPAYYIGEAVTRLGRHVKIVTGIAALVDVVPSPNGEAYIIPPLPTIRMPDPLVGEAVILSPINREIVPKDVPTVRGILAIDLQGFVRLPGVPTSRLDRNVDLCGLLRRTTVVKAGPDELAALDFASHQALLGKIVLETRGAAGLILHDSLKHHKLAAAPLSAEHTIGAGDTLLAAFVVALLGKITPLNAAQQALTFTAMTLRTRAPR